VRDIDFKVISVVEDSNKFRKIRFWNPRSIENMVMYNTNGFRIETMYDYYIAMKSMFLVIKLSSHSSIGYASLSILLL